MKATLSIVLFFTICTIQAQLATNNGALFFSSANSTSICNGGLLLLSGSFENNGQLTISKNGTLPQLGNLSINAGAVITNNGYLKIEQDLINDGLFSNVQGDVELFGNITQHISSTNGTETTFHNLICSGNGTNANKNKELDNVSASINSTGSVVLNNRVISTNNNNFLVSNPSTTAVMVDQTFGSEGYFQSASDGYFSWFANSNSDYLSPLGVNAAIEIYRPVIFTPNGTDTYNLRLTQGDASLYGFDLSNKNQNICQLNPSFFHEYKSSNGEVADLQFSYLLSADGSWANVAEYEGMYNLVGNNISNTFTYTFVQVPSNNYSASDSAFVLANQGPVAAFQINALDFFAQQIQFLNNSSNATNYSWTFGDGGSSSEYNPFHNYTLEGNFIILLEVTNALGCTDTASVEISSGGNLVVPTIFSPDGDLINEEFEVISPDVDDYHMNVYNRWGTLLFESFNQSLFWNGDTEDGIACTEGTYFYILKMKKGTNELAQDGYITLVRNK